MVFQGKINVSPAVQFTLQGRWLWKTEGIYKYVSSVDSCIYNKHAQAQNKARSLVNKTVKLRKHLPIKMIPNSRSRRFLMPKANSLLKSRRHFLIQLTFLTTLLLFSGRNTTTCHHRTCRRLQRNAGWIERVLYTYSNERFKKTLIISRETFRYILSKIEARLLDRPWPKTQSYLR